MLSILLFTLLLFGPLNGDVLLLTKQNFTTALEKYEYVLVNFYAPWCGHCKALEPEFLAASNQLSRTPVKLAKIDATTEEESELAYNHQVKAYPTLKFFHLNESVVYSGDGHLAADIVAWVRKQLEPPAKTLNSALEVQEFLEINKIAILGFFKNQTTVKARIFISLAKEMRDYAFGLSSTDEVFLRSGANDNDVIIFKPYDTGRAVYGGDFKFSKLKKFVQLETLPLIMEFEHEKASKILRGPTKSFLLFFLSNEGNQFEETVEPLMELAKYYREYVLFVTVTYGDVDKARAFEYFGVSKVDTPVIRLMTLDENDELIKYKPETAEISIKSVDDFLQQYLEGFLKRHYLSQPLPDDWDKFNVKVLVASNFYDVVLDENTVTLVEFYAPWCGHCKQLEPIMEQLAEHFVDDLTVIIAKIDGVANEVENLKVTTFPTIKLFRRYDNKMVDFDRARTFDELAEFVATNGELKEEGFNVEGGNEDDDVLDTDHDDTDDDAEHDEL